MSTRWAAGPAAPKRLLLGVVVPLLYIVALAIAVVTASSGRGGHAAPAPSAPIQLVGVHAKPTAKPHARRRHFIRRAPRKPTVRPHRRHRTVAIPTPVEPSVAPVVSRSAYRPVVEEPENVALVVRVAKVASPATMQSDIDACNGPVEIVWGFLPTEIAEHDYCGGSAFSALSTGQRVQVVGGSVPGIYVVNGQRRSAAAGSSADRLSGIGDLALQTCVPGGVILIGLDRVA